MSKISPKTLRIVYCATFIAIAVVVGSFLSFYVTESIKFNLAPVIRPVFSGLFRYDGSLRPYCRAAFLPERPAI